jgi:hypothetical protein
MRFQPIDCLIVRCLLALNFDLIDCTIKFIAEGKIEKTGESVHSRIDPRGRR